MLKNMMFNLLQNMESQADFLTWIIAIISICLVIYLMIAPRKKYHLPPGPRGLPVLGYLPFLGEEPYKDFSKLSKKYGHVFSLYLGQSYVVILNNFEAMKEAFSNSNILDHPENLFDILPDGVGFSSVNGKEWVEQRKYNVRAMKDLGLGGTRWEALVEEEVDEFVKIIADYNGKPVNIWSLLSSSVSNNITTLIFGERIPMNDPKRKLLDYLINVASQIFQQTGWRTFFPKLCDFLAKLGFSRYAKARKDMINLNKYIKERIEERKVIPNDESNNDVFIDSYLKEIQKNKENNLGNTFNEKNLRGNVQALLIGGSDSTRTSLIWLLLAMASFSDIQENVHKELDDVLGKEGKAKWSERSKLPYTFATILESQRWTSIGPLNTVRIAKEDVKIAGYDIPKGTIIISNTWALHNDPKYWPNPEEFKPQRFLNEDGRVIPKPDSFVPFSYGKRNCPGEIVAYIEILYYFTALLQKFKVLPPEGMKPNLNGTLGLSYQPPEQDLRFVPKEY